MIMDVAESRSGIITDGQEVSIERSDVEFRSCGVMLRGILLKPVGDSGPLPAIAMAPGMSEVKEGSITKFAEHFARKRFLALVYDNINFGDSEGQPRQEADPQMQRRGYRDALSYLSERPDVDGERLGIWGSSFAGGHVFEVAAQDRRVKCAVSQIGHISGLETSFHRTKIAQREALTSVLNEDRIKRFRGGEPGWMKGVSDDPTEACLMPGHAAFDYFMEQTRTAPNWQNKITLRSVDHMRGLDNTAYLPFISPTPLLMIVALADEMVPSDLSIAAYQTALEPKKLVLIPGNHFAAYKEDFALTCNAAIDWFIRHLVFGGSEALN
jgi:fermentation-respiration switch protein FrsA (DUF1100 family)